MTRAERLCLPRYFLQAQNEYIQVNHSCQPSRFWFYLAVPALSGLFPGLYLNLTYHTGTYAHNTTLSKLASPNKCAKCQRDSLLHNHTESHACNILVTLINVHEVQFKTKNLYVISPQIIILSINFKCKKHVTAS